MPIRDTERWNRLKSILFDAMELDPGAAQAHLKASCAGDAELLAEANRLLDIHREPDLRLDRQPTLLPDFSSFLTSHVLQPGRLLANRFRIEAFLGEGGIGEVYEATDTLLGQRLAIKTLHPFGAANPKIRDRFQRELQLARKASHPSICRLHDFAEDDGLAFITMELLEGETLAQRLKRTGPLSEAEARSILGPLCAGLDAAHAQSIVHRDLKPSNIMLCADGRVVIMDFGLALWAAEEAPAGATLPGSTLGTPAYMAPEQLDGRATGPASDIYSLGIIAFELVTGASPHAGLSPLAIAARRVQEPPPSPLARQAPVSTAFDAAVRQALALAPEARFTAATDFLEATKVPPPFWRDIPWRRLRWLAAVALVLAAFLAWPGLPPGSPDARRWFALGQIALDTRGTHAAGLLFQKAIEADPSFTLAYVRRAEALIEEDRYELARQLVLDAGGRHWWPFGTTHRSLEAVRAASLRDHAKAIALYGGLADAAPADQRTAARLALARAQVRGSLYADAMRTLTETTAENPQSAGAWLRRGAVERQLGQRDVALASLNRAEHILTLQRDLEGLAEVYCQQAISVPLQESGPLVARAVTLARELESPAARTRANFTASWLAVQRGDNDQAIRLAEEARDTAANARLDELAIQGLIDLAAGWSARYRMVDVQQLLRGAIAQADTIRASFLAARARFALAQSLSRLGDVDEMTKLLDHAAAYYRENGFTADHERVIRYRLFLDIRDARYSSARPAAEALRAAAVLRRDPDAIREADETLAEIEDHTGDLEAAIRRLDASGTELSGRDRRQAAAYAWANAAAGAVRFGDRERARALLNRARGVIQDPRSSAATYADLIEADLALMEDRGTEAARLAAQVAERSRQGSSIRVKLARSIIARAAGDLAGLEAAARSAEEGGQQFIIAVTAQRWLQGLIAAGRRGEALSRARSLVQHHQRTGHFVELTETRYLLALLSHTQPDLTAAEARWGRAALDRFLARPDLRRLAESLAR